MKISYHLAISILLLKVIYLQMQKTIRNRTKNIPTGLRLLLS